MGAVGLSAQFWHTGLNDRKKLAIVDSLDSYLLRECDPPFPGVDIDNVLNSKMLGLTHQ
ncbi:hypothetical protein [Candidatus Coxiella mudrowiae]|uniref:hypothetical protein n=1 Tax=Candidatus Coxiella mudrowiae TaxID=2054173 RepID=UPI001FD54066|nr:hypothetical protein [Candidatus Coxiella mudrowiae]